MQSTDLSASTMQRRSKRQQRVEFGVLYALCFPVLLVAVIVMRLVDLVLRRERDEPVRSIIREAREATGATIPYAFMG